VDYEEAFMRRHLFAVFIACVSIAGATEQALSDGAPSYDYAAPYTPTPQGWRGFYLGAHLGGTWGSSEATSGGTTLNDSWSAAPSGLVAGATLGYNWQVGPVIYGVEGDLGNLGLAGSATNYVPLGYDASTSTDTGFYMTLRGRVGVLMNGWMLYFTGGYIGADTTASVLEACDAQVVCPGPSVNASSSSFRNGWTLGGGFEAALQGAWSAKVESLFYDLGSTDVATNASFSGGPKTWNIETDGSLVRAGLNYRFNNFKFGQ
jgi:outer membrane immunogenic protein